MNDLLKPLAAQNQSYEDAETAIGGWLSAALDDPSVCSEMKQDIAAWFTAIECTDARELADRIVRKHGREFACRLVGELEKAL